MIFFNRHIMWTHGDLADRLATRITINCPDYWQRPVAQTTYLDALGEHETSVVYLTVSQFQCYETSGRLYFPSYSNLFPRFVLREESFM